MRLRLPPSARLHEAGEFARLKREGRTFPGKLMVVSVLREAATPAAPTRLGVITSRRVGGAVLRNRVRRRLRELFRLDRPQLRPGLWLVIIARAPAARATFASLRREWETLARRGDLFLPACAS